MSGNLEYPETGSRQGFTLVEMMVAMIVLVLISLMVAQMVSSSSSLAIGSRKRLDAEGQARLVLGRIGEDLVRMVKRNDVDFLFATPVGNDAFYFYSEAPASFASAVTSVEKSGVALVGYRVNSKTTDTNYTKLERLGKGLKWSGATSGQVDSMVFLTQDASGASVVASKIPTAWATVVGTSPAFQNGTDAGFQVLADGVIRLEIAFLKKDGTLTQDPDLPADNLTNNLSDVSAIVVTIAVLDEASQKLIDKAKVVQIAAALPDPTAADFSSNPPVLMAKKWKDILNGPALASSLGLPVLVASQVRVYQRIFSLDKP